jgi:hypothetical protein
VCYEEAVVEMKIDVGDDDVRVGESLKNERPPREGREARELAERELGLSFQFHSFLGKR